MSNLFDAAAERLAMTTGRPLSQERAELTAPTPTADDLPLFLPDYSGDDEACQRCGHTFYRHDTFDVYDEDGEPTGETRGGEGALACSICECDNFAPTGRPAEADADERPPHALSDTLPRCPTHGTPLLLESGGGGRRSCPRCA